ncbi:glycosyltransferase family 4 protein [Methylocella sp.]|uniref:glycosyltransferase family 4 protein n=1 Tax=Methylocella sp. TaxID=1978226 RepID=UPI0035AE0D6B
MNALLLMDLTRLVGRPQIDTPTGIDRVEFEYARHLLAGHSERLRFVLRWRGHMRIVGRRATIAFLDLVEEQWRYNKSGSGRRATRRIEAFLGDPGLGEFAAASDSPGRRSAARKLWRLKARMIATSRRLSAGTLGAHGGLYVNVSHEGLHSDLGIRPLVERGALAPIFFVHDLIPITHPEYVKRGRAARHRARMATMLSLGAALIANSRHTGDILSRYAMEEGFAPRPVAVAPLGSGFPAFPRPTEEPSAAPFFVTLGTIEPRKNHIFLLQLWRQLVEAQGETAPKLLVIGRRGWENENAVDLIERCPAIRSHVLECAAVSDDVLEYLISRCRAVLFPSFAEGYGMPLVEALALKAPVIASDLPVFREIGAAAPEFLDPLDGPGWAQMIRAYAEPGSSRRAAQLERIARVELPNWERHFSVFDKLLASCASLLRPAKAAV